MKKPFEMKKIAVAAAVAALGMSAVISFAAAPSVPRPNTPEEQRIGKIEQVFTFRGAMPTGVTVAENGRVFVNFPRWGDDVPFTVGEIRNGKVIAYPNAAINKEDPSDPAKGFISVQSVVADGRGRIWVLDTAAPGFAAPKAGGAKLVAIDMKTDKIVQTIVFPADVILPTTYVNDVRFDFRTGGAGTAYITDSSISGPGGIIVMDLASGRAIRRLSGDSSTSPDPAFVPIVEGEAMMARGADGSAKRFTVASDGIALSADGETLYFCALSSRHLFSIPTRMLRDPSVTDAQLSAAVRDLGEKGASDGLEADAAGAVYAGDYEHNSIRKLTTDTDGNGTWKTIAHDPRMLWPDTLSVGPDGYLYFTANQLHRQAGFHAGKDMRTKPYSLMRIRIDAAPAPTH